MGFGGVAEGEKDWLESLDRPFFSAGSPWMLQKAEKLVTCLEGRKEGQLSRF